MDFSIEEGEFVGFLGPSGCGKSTLLSMIAGLMTPTCGYVENTFPKKSMSFVFQEASLMPWQTVEKNIALPLELLNQPKEQIENSVELKLETFGLKEFRNFTPQNISGGMKMRTSLARALVSQPSLLLLDEPFSSLDETLRERCAQEVYDIWSLKKLTAILVTHSVPEAVALCDKIFILSHRPSTILEIIDVKKELGEKKGPFFRDSEKFHLITKKVRNFMETKVYV